jgi:hypothetical protein
MSDDVDLWELLAAPLTALIKAEAQTAMASLAFIEQVGFTGGGGAPVESEAAGARPHSLGALRMVHFQYHKPRDSGSVQQVMAVPLLSLVPIPMLRLKETTLEYDVEVVAVNRETAKPSTVAASVSPAPAVPAVAMLAKMAPTAAARASSASAPRHPVHIKMQIVPSDLPAGVQQLLHVSSTSAAVSDADPNPSPPAQFGGSSRK